MEKVILAAAAAIHLVLMFREGHWLKSGLNVTMVLFTLLSLSVYVIAALLARRQAWSPRRRLLAVLAVAALGPGVAAHGIFVTGGDQRGLVFLFLPVLQWVAVAVAAL